MILILQLFGILFHSKIAYTPSRLGGVLDCVSVSLSDRHNCRPSANLDGRLAVDGITKLLFFRVVCCC